MNTSSGIGWARLVAQGTGCVSLVLGLIVLLGWYTHSTILIQVLPQFVPMQYNTALCFLLSGVGLIAVSYEVKKASFVCGAIVALIGILTLVQYILGVNLGIDQLLMDHYITTQTSHPGRMAPNTALCFSLSGVALLINSRSGNQTWTEQINGGLGLLVMALGIVAVVGYLGGVETAYGWANLTRMAVHTSVGFIILGSGIALLANPRLVFGWRDASPELIASIAAFIVFMLGVSLSQNAEKNKIDQIKSTQKLEFLLVQKHISSTFRTHMLAMERLADRWGARGGTPKGEWRKDVRNYLADQPGLRAIEWVDPQFKVRWIEPIKGNEAALNLDLSIEPKRANVLRESRDSRRAILSSPIDLVQGGKGFLGFFPIYMENKFDGFILGVFDIKAVLDSVLPITFTKDYNVSFRIDNEYVNISDTADSEIKGRLSHEGTVNVYGAQWHLKTWPKTEFLNKHRTYLPETILFAGIFISFLVALSIYFGVSAYKRSLQLADSEEQHRAVVENAVDGLVTTDSRGTILKINSACETIFGYSQEEMVGYNVKMLMPEPYHGEHDTYIARHLETGEKKIIGSSREVQGRRKDGSVFPVELSVNDLTISGEKIFSGIIRDITERKTAETDREKLIDKLTESNEQLERFAYICSHDMQEPMRMVRSFSRKLQDHLGGRFTSDEKAMRYLKFVTDGAERSQNLVEDILTYSSLDKDTMKPEEVDLNALLGEILETIRFGLEERGGEVTKDILPIISGNKTQYYQLFQNLVNNGLKYQPAGAAPNVHVGVSDKGDHWEFFVKDNGIGIASRHQKKIFEVFQRLHRTEEYAGTGVGLSICKKIVERHGGRIWLESVVGKGSTFYFSLSKASLTGAFDESERKAG